MSAGQYGHAGQHHGDGSPGCPRELHHHHDARCEMPAARYERARRDRKQRAAEAGHDAVGDPSLFTLTAAKAVAEAVGVAIRVKITRDIVEAAELTGDYSYVDMIAAAFAAAGFEVIE